MRAISIADAASMCPVCATETGLRVREAVFGPDFGSNLFAISLPVLLLLAVVAGLHYAFARRGAERRA